MGSGTQVRPATIVLVVEPSRADPIVAALRPHGHVIEVFATSSAASLRVIGGPPVDIVAVEARQLTDDSLLDAAQAVDAWCVVVDANVSTLVPSRPGRVLTHVPAGARASQVASTIAVLLVAKRRQRSAYLA
jgi:hypothetical protein